MTNETWRKDPHENDPFWAYLVVPEAEGFDLLMPTWLADRIIADHQQVAALPEWALKGRDGEPVTLLQKLEQAMEFGSAMERLAIENNQQVAALRAALVTLAHEAASAAGLLRSEWVRQPQCSKTLGIPAEAAGGGADGRET